MFLPGESHGQRSLVGRSPRGCTESDTTEATWQQQYYDDVRECLCSQEIHADVVMGEEVQ